jgi:type IV secretion system protein VirB6
VFNGDFGYYVAGAIVWVLMGLVCVYTMFLIALSSIALAVLLALGPLFIALLLFDATRRFFEAWIGYSSPARGWCIGAEGTRAGSRERYAR